MLAHNAKGLAAALNLKTFSPQVSPVNE